MCHLHMSVNRTEHLFVPRGNMEATSANQDSAMKDENNVEVHTESSSDVELIEEKHPIVEVSDSDNEDNQNKGPLTVTASESDEMSDVLSLDIDIETIDVIDPNEFVL